MESKIHFAGDLIESFLQSLDDKNIEYAVLRNYTGLPFSNLSKDIDILIHPSKLEQSHFILMSCSYKLGYTRVWYNPLDYLKGYAFLKVNENINSVKIDLFNGLLWRGMEYLDAKEILSKRIKYNSISVLNEFDESIVSYFYYALYAKKIRAKYHNKIIKTFESSEITFRFQQLYDAKNSQQLIQEGICDLNKSVQKFRKKIILRLFIKSLGFKYLVRLIKHIYTEYFLRLKFGYFISFSGPDGVGKSTLVNSLNNIFLDLGITDKKIPDHLLSPSVPALHNTVIAKKSTYKHKYDKPYSVKPVSYFESILRSFYYFIIFIIDGCLIFNRKRKNNIVIYDRYIMDFSADTKRMRIKMPDIISKLFLKILRFENINVVINAEVNQILARKDELNKEQIIYLLDRYNDLSSSTKRSIIFSNSKSIIQSQKDFLNLIFTNIQTHYNKY